MRLRDLAPDERPRERLLACGPAELRDEELLAIVLGTGRGSGEDALQLATRLIAEGGGLTPLAGSPAEALGHLHGVGPVKLSRIAAAFELGRRAHGRSPAARGEGRPGPSPAAAAGPSTPAVEAVPEWRRVVAEVRSQIAIGERALLAVRRTRQEPPVTLALGEALGPSTRAGAVLARLLAAHGSGAWWVIALRPGGALRKPERDAADRISAAARLVDVPLAGVALAAGSQAHLLCADGSGGGAP